MGETKTINEAIAEKFVLTADNYFSKDRPHISVSQIKDYLRCPAFYKRRHIDKDPLVQIEPTDSMKRGSLVDDLLTRGETKMQAKVLKKDDAELFEKQKEMDERLLIGARYWDEAQEVAAAVKAHPLWLPRFATAKSEYQVLLSDVTYNENASVPVCGLADRIDTIDKESHADYVAEIIDLKVVSPVKLSTPTKWMWNVREMKYAHQFALYQKLKSIELGCEPSLISCRHVVAAFVEPGFVEVRSYIIPQGMLDEALAEIEYALKGIAAGNFEKKVHGIEELPYSAFNDGFDDEAEENDAEV